MEHVTQPKHPDPRRMRRATKEVTDRSKIEAFLDQSHVGYLGLVDDEGTYVVPLRL
ncbi:hypothetical protein [Aneurinibacillus sp. Ricciae_BoGa-3]|uniref:hypothetical protein n=1 Tax=Aneurinibacillus sp. Ricciae_BoGa-3 TaxID=3022697 RepID=UPI002FEE301B